MSGPAAGDGRVRVWAVPRRHTAELGVGGAGRHGVGDLATDHRGTVIDEADLAVWAEAFARDRRFRLVVGHVDATYEATVGTVAQGPLRLMRPTMSWERATGDQLVEDLRQPAAGRGTAGKRAARRNSDG